MLLVNMAMVQYNVGRDEFLQSTTSVFIARSLGFFAVAAFCYLTYLIWQSVRGKVPASALPKPPAPPAVNDGQPVKPQPFKAPQAPKEGGFRRETAKSAAEQYGMHPDQKPHPRESCVHR